MVDIKITLQQTYNAVNYRLRLELSVTVQIPNRKPNRQTYPTCHVG